MAIVARIENPTERGHWTRFLADLWTFWGHGWASVVGGYVRNLLQNMPDIDLRRLADFTVCDPTQRPSAAEGLRAAWRAVRGGRSPGDPPTRQYQYTVDYRLHVALCRINPALAAVALPSKMPTGWFHWRHPIGPHSSTNRASPPVPVAPLSVVVEETTVDFLGQLLDRCTSVVERLILRLFATTRLPPRDVRRLRWNPASGGLCLMRKAVVKPVPMSAEVQSLVADWRPTAIKSYAGYLFAHNSRVCVREGYLTRVVGAVLGGGADASTVAAVIDRLRSGGD